MYQSIHFSLSLREMASLVVAACLALHLGARAPCTKQPRAHTTTARYHLDDDQQQRQPPPYLRAAADDDPHVDVDAVNVLLAERAAARAAANFDAADAIRETLRADHSVVVSDRDLTWFVATGGYSRSATDRAYDGADDGLDMDEVGRLLAARDAARADRAFERADELRDELRSRFHIIVSDRDRTWFVDQRAARGEEGGGGGSRRRAGGYTRDTRDESVVDVDAVEELLSQRNDARRQRDFDLADELREQLLGEYNVLVRDDEKIWSVKGRSERSSRAGAGYGGGGGGGSTDGLSPDAIAEIGTLLEERDACRRQRDFAAADEIRDDLMKRFSVRIDDRDRSWAVAYSDDGRRRGPPGATPPQRERPVAEGGHDYSRAPDDVGALDGAQLAQVDSLLAERLAAKFARDFERADALLARIEDMGVRVHEQQKLWRADGGDFYPAKYTLVGDAGATDVFEVERLLNERLDAKRARDYNRADLAHQRLTAMSVQLDDRRRTWSVVHAAGYRREGPKNPAVDDAVVEDLLVQRLAAKRARDYDTADELQFEIKKMGVWLDNRSRVWRWKGNRDAEAGP